VDELEVKREVERHVHQVADELDWPHLNIEQKKIHYEAWTNDEDIGGRLRQVIDPGKVRVYLKDTIMKRYFRNQRPCLPDFLRSLSVAYGSITQTFIKPEALLSSSHDLFTLTVAKEWKVAVMSAYERGFEVKHLRRNVVFVLEHTSGRFVDQSYKDLINTAGAKLGVEIRWVM